MSKVANAVVTARDSKEAWRWGIGGFFGILLIGFVMVQGAKDRDYMKTKFTATQDKLASSLDNLGDAIQAGTAVSQMMVTEFKTLAAETDDVGDEMRAQVKQFERFLNTIEKHEVAKPVLEE